MDKVQDITIGGGIVFSGRTAVAVYQAMTLKHALKLYAKTGIKANRAYTPSAMMRLASGITGKRFKARDYIGAIAALEVWINNLKVED